MKKTLLTTAFGLTLLGGLNQAALAFEITHSEGTLTLDNMPQKIVSYELSHLDTLTTLGIDAVAVPQSIYSGNLEKYNDSPTVGTLFEPDYEALKKIQPDLIIAGGRSAAVIPELSKIAPTISFANDPTQFLDSVKNSVNSLATAFDKTEKAEQLIKQLDQNVAQLHKANADKTGTFLFIMKDHIIPHAPGDRFGYLEELTGLSPVLKERTPEELNQPRPQPDSPEAKAMAKKRAEEISSLVKADPDWFIVLDRGAINEGEKTAAKTLAKHPELSQTTAFKQKQVHYVEPNAWYIVTGGINNLTHLTDQMIQAMDTKN